jgi:hypothetical protein
VIEDTIMETIQFLERPITVTRNGGSIGSFQATASETEIIHYAFDAYGFLLRSHMTTAEPHHFSFSEFADAIAAVYDQNEPRHQLIIRTLRTIHDRQVATISQAVHIPPKRLPRRRRKGQPMRALRPTFDCPGSAR